MDARLKQYPEAKALYEKAQQDNYNAAFDLAIFYDDTLNDNKKAIYWYEVAYKGKTPGAAYNLGYIYEKELHNYTKAVEWYEKAAKRGDIKAPMALGLVYEEHYKNNDKAIEWYKKAYEIGDYRFKIFAFNERRL